MRKKKGDGITAPSTRTNKEYRKKRAAEVKTYGRRTVKSIERIIKESHKYNNRIKPKRKY
jgi:hypothetical protein